MDLLFILLSQYKSKNPSNGKNQQTFLFAEQIDAIIAWIDSLLLYSRQTDYFFRTENIKYWLELCLAAVHVRGARNWSSCVLWDCVRTIMYFVSFLHFYCSFKIERIIELVHTVSKLYICITVEHFGAL